MPDIIQDAKKALEGTTPGPWELYGGEIHQIQHAPEQCTSFRCDHRWPVLSESWGESAAVAAADEDLALMAAVPEIAQALAEETYEYAVAFKSTNGLGYLDRSGKPQPWPCLTAWYLTKEIAQVALMNSEYRKEALCIVRRRVSPVEVISD